MGFFGFFATMVGLGAMTKDAISDSIDDVRSRERATENGRDYYLVNGYKMRSTKTGRDCTERMNYETGHMCLYDLRTGEIVADITKSINKEKTEKNKRESKAQGRAFYRTCEFDLPCGKTSDVWVNDNMPGKYFTNIRLRNYEDFGKEVFKEGELVDYIIGSDRRKKVKKYSNTPYYNPDGTINVELSKK